MSYAESIKKGEYTHTSVSLDVMMKAPVVVVPKDIFDSTSTYIKVDFGMLKMVSNLIPYDSTVNYNEFTNDSSLYDQY